MKNFVIIVLVAIIGIFAWMLWKQRGEKVSITSFDECMAAGYPIMESYPRQCNTPDGRNFVEEIENNEPGPNLGNGNADEKANLIVLESPRPGETISSPAVITGRARGNWFFEASFPVVVVDWNGQIIGEGYAEAQSEWMTTEFVPFKATVTFDVSKIQNNYSNRGALILQKDNPSGLPEHDDALEIPVMLE